MATSEDSLASGRDRRSNAGARMSRLLDAEDDDDFYKTTYGGFTEVGVVPTFICENLTNTLSPYVHRMMYHILRQLTNQLMSFVW